MSRTTWHTLDKKIDAALAALRARALDPATDTQRLAELLTALG